MILSGSGIGGSSVTASSRWSGGVTAAIAAASAMQLAPSSPRRLASPGMRRSSATMPSAVSAPKPAMPFIS